MTRDDKNTKTAERTYSLDELVGEVVRPLHIALYTGSRVAQCGHISEFDHHPWELVGKLPVCKVCKTIMERKGIFGWWSR